LLFLPGAVLVLFPTPRTQRAVHHHCTGSSTTAILCTVVLHYILHYLLLVQYVTVRWCTV
jgi:hypothetical protein